jgi:acyl-CoA thioesterase FadM
MSGGVSIRIERRVEWSDTDASGFHHNTFITRLFEAAEAALHEKAGLGTSLFGRIPRVRTTFEFKQRLAFGDVVEAHLWVEAIGRTSLTYRFEARKSSEVAADGEVIVVHVRPESAHGEEWPAAVRRALSSDGESS